MIRIDRFLSHIYFHLNRLLLHSSSDFSHMKIIIAVLLLCSPLLSMAAPVTLELHGGSTFKGELIKWDGETAHLKAEFGEISLKKVQLTQKSIDMLTTQSGDTSGLRARVVELEKTVESLMRDNAALRVQLQGQKGPAQAVAPETTSGLSRLSAPVAETTKTASSQTTSSASDASYWISSTGKRHNSNCRYFKTSKGAPGSAGQGTACKICGG